LSGESGILRLSDASVRFPNGREIAFEDTTFNEGDRVALVGANGCGKSTLCQVLAGLTSLTRGQVTRSPSLRSAKTAYLPQSGGFFPDLTVGQNISLIRRLYGLREPFDPRLFQGIWDLGLAAEINSPVRSLSGGFAHLTALASTIATGATCVILDEPFSGLDESRHQAATKAISSLANSVSLLFVTAHHASEIAFANRTIVIGAKT